MANDAESSFRALIDEKDFSQNPVNAAQRGNRTKSLLSGGFGRPATMQPPQQQQAPFVPAQQQGWRPPEQPWRPPQGQGFLGQPQPSSYGPGRADTSYGPAAMGGGFGGSAPLGGYYGSSQAFPQYGGPGRADPSYGRTDTSYRPTAYQPLFGGFGQNAPQHRHRHRHGRHRRHRGSRSKTRPNIWETSIKSGQQSRSRRSNASYQSFATGSRRRDRYGISDTESVSRSSHSSSSSFSSSSSTSTSSGRHRRRHGLSTLQKKLMLRTIRDYIPDKNVHDFVYQDVCNQMEMMEKNGHRLPKDYDKSKHDISDNELHLYEQQVQRDRGRDYKKVSNLLKFSATGLSNFCQFMQVDWIKTTKLPKIIKEALEEGEFEDCMEGIGSYLRGTIFDHPIFSTILKFVEKVGEAHNTEMEEDQERLEEEEDRRDRKHQEALRKLNNFRSDSARPGTGTLDGVPPPRRARAPTSESDEKTEASRSRKSTASTAATQEEKKMT